MPSVNVNPSITLPLAIVIGLSAQAVSIVWWASAMDRRMSTVESSVQALENIVDVRSTWGETLARLDERSLTAAAGIERIEMQLQERDD